MEHLQMQMAFQTVKKLYTKDAIQLKLETQMVFAKAPQTALFNAMEAKGQSSKTSASANVMLLSLPINFVMLTAKQQCLKQHLILREESQFTTLWPTRLLLQRKYSYTLIF